MAGLREMKLRLQSVKNTKKITYAMKLVAAAKLRKAQEAVQRGRVYTEALGGLLKQLSAELAGVDSTHPLMEKRDVKKIRFLIIGGGRGLCGGYNTNLHRKIDAAWKQAKVDNPGAEITATILGRKPAEYFRRINRSYLKSLEELGEDTSKWPLEDVCRELEAQFIAGEIDELYLVYTKFKSAITMTPTVDKLLPMDASAVTEATKGESKAATAGVTLFEPSAAAVFAGALPRILRSRVRQAAFDAKAGETGARMTAMDAATKNAGELGNKLTLTVNKLRQSRITSELLDILGGAQAN